MRISDWSSDVCSSDLVHRKVDRVDAKPVNPALQPEAHDTQQRVLHVAVVDVELRLRAEEIMEIILAAPRVPRPGRAAEHRLPVGRRRPVGPGIGPDIPVRSEEHTSELQSLMRISYAVFCLKK